VKEWHRCKRILVLTVALASPLLAYSSELTDNNTMNYFSATQSSGPTSEEPIYRKPIFAKKTIAEVPSNSLAQALGWVSNGQNMCGGYYIEPSIVLNYPNPDSPTKEQTTITATLPSLFSQTGTSILQGRVTVTQPGRQLIADRAYLLRDSKTGKVFAVELVGNVHMREAGKIIVTQYAYVNLKNNSAILRNSVYRFSKITKGGESLNGWGTVVRGEREASGVLNFWNATYSTCPPTNTSWRVRAKHLQLDKKKGEGKATGAFFDIKGTPVFYWPYFTFPLDNRRKTGFLFPTFGYSSQNGSNFSIPFYLNLAPNYDATITPNYMSLRGLQLGVLFRYLTTKSFGVLNSTILPNDLEFAEFKQNAPGTYSTVLDENLYLSRLNNSSNTRGLFSYQDSTVFDPHWSTKINLNYVTDDYYFQDFGSTPALASTDQLLNETDLHYQGEHWHFLGRVQGYQTLHPINELPVQDLYARLPELNFDADYPRQWLGLNYQLNTQAVYFDQRNNFITGLPAVTGDRFNLDPIISLPLANMSGYFIPQLQVDGTDYALKNQDPGLPNSINRVLPMFDIDSGLYFDRDMHLGTHDYRQTLEPRVYYLYVPVSNQDNIPLFDTTLPPFSYEQMFQTNRFTGIDRIGDANQVTFALTTRFLDAFTGQEKLRASIGQIYAIKLHQVVCTDINCMPDPMADEHASPIVGELSYFLNSNWNVTSDLAWDLNRASVNDGALNFTYSHDRRILNLSYYYVRNGDIETQTNLDIAELNPVNSGNLNRIGLAAALPVTEHWSLVGNWNYNISYRHSQNFFYGAEYDSCCWAVRLLASSNLTTVDQLGVPQFNHVYYVQFQLKGLGNIGNSDPTTLLTSTLPGYHDNFQGQFG
jgi:LPS-assembly protein